MALKALTPLASVVAQPLAQVRSPGVQASRQLEKAVQVGSALHAATTEAQAPPVDWAAVMHDWQSIEPVPPVVPPVPVGQAEKSQ